MIRFAADENFNMDIVRGLRRRAPNTDIVTVLDAGLSGADDAAVLDWAASSGRILLTHDVSTIPAIAYERVEAGLPMPGVFEVPCHAPRRAIIDDLLLIAQCSVEREWEGQVRYLPL